MGSRLSARPIAGNRLITAAAAVALAAGVVGATGAVSASSRPTISQVTAEVSALTTAENKAVQAYDQVSQQLTAASGRLAQVGRELTRARKQFATMRGDVAQVAATAYEDGNMNSMAVLLTSADPQTVLARASVLLQLSSARYAEMHQFVAAARQLTMAQQEARRTETAIAALRNQRKARAGSIGRALTEKKALLATLTAKQRQTVEAVASPGSGGTTAISYHGPTSTSAEHAVAFAYAQLGCPYVWGGTGPCADGYDCSGLVQAAWAHAGVAIPRDTYEQWAALPHVPLSDLEPGDLVFFNGESHVGMYVGGGMLIDAPVPGESVERISLSEPWYAETEDGAARP